MEELYEFDEETIASFLSEEELEEKKKRKNSENFRTKRQKRNSEQGGMQGRQDFLLHLLLQFQSLYLPSFISTPTAL